MTTTEHARGQALGAPTIRRQLHVLGLLAIPSRGGHRWLTQQKP